MKDHNDIKKERRGLARRGLHESSYFEVEFPGGATRTEHDTNWSEMSEETLVEYLGTKKIVYLSTYPITGITIYHHGQEAHIDVPEGCRAYQSVKGAYTFLNDGSRVYSTHGRTVGIVKDSVVIQEFFIDEKEGDVKGFKS